MRNRYVAASFRVRILVWIRVHRALRLSLWKEKMSWQISEWGGGYLINMSNFGADSVEPRQAATTTGRCDYVNSCVDYLILAIDSGACNIFLLSLLAKDTDNNCPSRGIGTVASDSCTNWGIDSRTSK